MKTFFTLLIGLVLLSNQTVAQTAIDKTTGTSEAFVAISFEEIEEAAKTHDPINLREFRKPNPVVYRFDPEIDPALIIYEEQPGQIEPAVMRETSPMPNADFEGLDDSGNSIPPDVHGAAGPDHLMVTLNTQVRIQDRQGNNLSTMTLGSFWLSLPGSGTFDPKIVYDHYEDRWIFVACAGSEPGSSRIYLGVTENSDPTGTWFLYSYIADADNIVWFDYPSIGFNKKWIAVSGNMFGGANYRTVYVFDKHALYAGTPNSPYTRFATTQGFTIVPAYTFDNEVEELYMVSTGNGNQGGSGFIQQWKISGETENPQLTMMGFIGTPNPWSGWAGQNGDFLPQLGSAQKINSVDHRMWNVVYRNEKIWATHHIFLPAGNPNRTAVQWWELSTDGEVLQRGRIDDPTGEMSYAYSSIAVNAFEDIVIGHNNFSANQYASSAYSFRAHFDPPNSIRTSYQYKDGLAPYYKTFGGGRNRWGDYSATMVDPVNDVDFWVLQEYADTPLGNDRWGTWWAYLQIPFQTEPEFVADETLIPAGEIINFTDLTAGVPQTWEWHFEGGDPETSTEQHPQGILFANEGSFTVTLTTTNDFGTNTISKENYITTSTTLLPEVAFEAEAVLVCTGQTVKFYDQTNYLPREWEWTFTPSTVSFMNGTNAFSQHPEVRFDEADVYSVTLLASNLNGSVSETVFEMIRVGGLEMPYSQQFESLSFDDEGWTVENPDNQITWETIEVGGLNEITTAAFVDFYNYMAIGRRDRLISPPLDLRNFSNMNLTFKHAYAQRNANYSDSLIVYISDNCGQNWTRLFADAENGSGNFATHPLTDGFIPQNVWDWCGVEWGAGCITLNLNEYVGQTDIRIAFETFSFFGNPLYITDIRLGPTVNLDDHETYSAGIRLFPNPTDGRLTVRSATGQLEKVEILTATGLVVFRNENIDNQELNVNLTGLAKGVYIVKTSLAGQVYTERLMLK